MTLFESIYEVLGIIGSIVGIIALVICIRDKIKIEPKIVQAFVRVMDNGDYLIHHKNPSRKQRKRRIRLRKSNLHISTRAINILILLFSLQLK